METLIERGGCSCLPPKPLECGGASGQFRSQKFYSDGPAQSCVLGSEYNSHAAGAELTKDAIV